MSAAENVPIYSVATIVITFLLGNQQVSGMVEIEITNLGINEFQTNLVATDVDDLAGVLYRAKQKYIQRTYIISVNCIADVFVYIKQCTGS